jgi:enoyl-CoA hydratase
MEPLVRYEFDGQVATVRMDDGKVNALSAEMFSQLNGALDQAQADEAVLLLTGRDRVFSAGFDLAVLNAGGTAALQLLKSGFELAERLLSFPRPVVIACGGHAVAMGVFLLLSGDYRVGALGPYKITANEVAIGLTMPRAAVEILRQRLAPADFNRATILAEVYQPADAVAAGFLDRVVEPDDVLSTALEIATALTQLDNAAHQATKLRARRIALQAIRDAIVVDAAQYEEQAHAPAQTTNA